MPIDGISSQSSGFQHVNPTEVNVQAESAAKAEAERLIKEADKSDKAKADSEEEDKDRDLQGRDTDEDGSDDEENFDQNPKFLQTDKKFKVTFNSSSEMVEMLDVNTGEIVETIAPDDLINVLSKSKRFSGLFVDRKI